MKIDARSGVGVKKVILQLAILVLVAGIVFALRLPKQIDPVAFSPEMETSGSSIVSYEEVATGIDFQFKNPLAIAVDQNNNVYVSEFYAAVGDNARILKFNAKGRYMGWFGKGSTTTGWHDSGSTEKSLPGSGDGEFIGVSKIAFADDGRIYVLDGASINTGTGNYRIQVFDKDWGFLGWIGRGDRTMGWHGPNSGEVGVQTTEPGGFHQPDGMIVQKGEIIVGGWNSYRVDRFRTDGTYLGWLGKVEGEGGGWHRQDQVAVAGETFGNDAVAFTAPVDFARRDNKLYVIDFYNDPVLSVFDYETGTFLWGKYHAEINKPEGFILDRFGNIITADFYEGSVKFFDPQGSLKTALSLGHGSDYWGASGFAFDSNGMLYFTEYMQNKVHKIRIIYE